MEEKICEEYTLIIQTFVPIIWPTISWINSPIHLPSAFLDLFHGIVKYMEMGLTNWQEYTNVVYCMIGVTLCLLHNTCWSIIIILIYVTKFNVLKMMSILCWDLDIILTSSCDVILTSNWHLVLMSNYGRLLWHHFYGFL